MDRIERSMHLAAQAQAQLVSEVEAATAEAPKEAPVKKKPVAKKKAAKKKS